jgi:hypothetical protein
MNELKYVYVAPDVPHVGTRKAVCVVRLRLSHLVPFCFIYGNAVCSGAVRRHSLWLHVG